MFQPITYAAATRTPGRSDTPNVDQGSLDDLLRLLGMNPMETPDARGAADHIPVELRRVKAGRSLVNMGTPASAFYFVRSGTFKVSRNDEDGYEQVMAFAGRGEILAYDALCLSTHPTAAVALEDSTVFVVRKADLSLINREVPMFEWELHRLASQALARTNDLVDVMAAVSSEVRLARFLLNLSRQLAANGQSPRRFVLRMSRRDIGSMLGVAHETVSRAFSALAMARLLLVNDRDVEILDMDGLRSYARSTRRGQDELAAARSRRLSLQTVGARQRSGLEAMTA